MDRSEVVGFDRPPQWTAEAVVGGTGDDETEHKVGSGGVGMVELNLPTVDGRPLWYRPKGHVYRCGACRFATFDTGTMKNHAMEHYPTPPEKVITHEPRGSAAGSPADGSAPRPAESSGTAGGGGSPGLSQRERVRAVVGAVADGAESVGEVVGRVDADADAVRSTLKRLKEKGELVEAADGTLRR